MPCIRVFDATPFGNLAQFRSGVWLQKKRFSLYYIAFPWNNYSIFKTFPRFRHIGALPAKEPSAPHTEWPPASACAHSVFPARRVRRTDSSVYTLPSTPAAP